MEKKLDLVLNELKNINTSMNHLETKIENIDTRLSTIERKTDVVNNQVASNSELLNKINASQKRLEMNVETLALRSIDHETELRELRLSSLKREES